MVYIDGSQPYTFVSIDCSCEDVHHLHMREAIALWKMRRFRAKFDKLCDAIWICTKISCATPITTLVNVYVALPVFTHIAGTL